MGMVSQTTAKGIQMDIKDLTSEQIAKVKACNTSGELVALAKEEGVELTDEQLDKVAGGQDWDEFQRQHFECRYCGKRTYFYPSEGKPTHCAYCGEWF